MFLRYEIHAEGGRHDCFYVMKFMPRIRGTFEFSYVLENVRMHIIPGVEGRTRISAGGRLQKIHARGPKARGHEFF